MNILLKSARRFLFRKQRHKASLLPPAELLPASHRLTLAIVGDRATGFTGKGKVNPAFFFPPFLYELGKSGVFATVFVDDKDFARNAGRLTGRKTIVLPIYNEEHPEGRRRAERMASVLPSAMILNSPATGAILADKTATAAAYRVAGIDVTSPARRTETTFSLARLGSHRPVAVLPPGAAADPRRHNTAFVDTVHEFDGLAYYVSLRLMAFGGELVGAFPRLRPVSEGDPSVHDSDTPRNPKLILAAHRQFVQDRFEQLTSLCAQIGAVLGPGFYAHDILPERGSDRMIVCETGYKFFDYTYPAHLAAIAADLPELASVLGPDFCRASAQAVSRYLPSGAEN